MRECLMGSIFWASLIASSIIAALTTLIVEYVAKPRLEARKDRILETFRERRIALKDVKKAAHLAGRLSTYKHGDGLPELAERANKIAEELDSLTVSVYEALYAPEDVEDEWSRVTASINGFTITFRRTKPDEKSWKEFGAATDLLQPFAILFSTPRWKWRRRKILIRNIKAASQGVWSPGSREVKHE